MRTRGAVLAILGALVATLALVPNASDAAAARLTVTVTTKAPQAGKPVAFSGSVPGTRGRPVRLELRRDGRWVALSTARSGQRGSYRLAAKLTAGTKKLRVVAPAVRRHRALVSRTLTLAVRAAAPAPTPSGPPAVRTNGCTPGTSATDPDADAAAAALVDRFAGWRRTGVTAVGQQVNISSDTWARALTDLAPDRVTLVGFDLEELEQAADRGKDFVPDLIALARDGAVLGASWHAHNPWTGGGSLDRVGADRLADLLDESTEAGARFWASWDDEVAAPLDRLRRAGVAIVLRPFHEAGGDWFWWASPDPAVYRALWNKAQQRAAAVGLQNVLWSYGAAVRNRSGIADPLTLLPGCVEIGGLDTYDPEHGDPVDRVNLTDYARLAAKVPFFGLSEVGPFGSDGSWDPAVVSRTLKAQRLYASFASFWFDDGDGSGEYGGKKQLASLTGGREWLASCAAATGVSGLCPAS